MGLLCHLVAGLGSCSGRPLVRPLDSSVKKVTRTAVIRRQDSAVIYLFQRDFCWLMNKSHFWCVCVIESCAQVILKFVTGSVFVSSRFTKGGGVKPKPLSLADGHTEDGLTQEQWAPLTKTTPPRHVASYHRGNPPWDRERG